MSNVKLLALICFIVAIVFFILYVVHVISWELTIAVMLTDLTLFETGKVLVT